MSKHLGFKKLAGKVTREYERKGVSKKKARLWGRETAAKVAREKGLARGKH